MARILVIDDDDSLRDIMTMMLTEAGHTVRQASDGRKGVALFRAEPADVVVTDLVMPEQEGIETIMELRRSYPRLPIVAVSGGLDNSEIYLNIAAKVGAHRTLAKPFSAQDLLAAIEDALREPAAGAAD
jgi:DNA-binding response OmpR family regulator